MRKGSGKNQCGNCSKPLTEDVCSPSIFKKGTGRCRSCARIQNDDWKLRNPEKAKAIFVKRKQNFPKAALAATKKYHRTLKGRHAVLKYKFIKEGVPVEDPIFNINFYSELIKDNECHYCLGPLGTTSHGLDAIDNNLGHICFNVVPCCRSCNQKKMNDTSYEEMMLLAPALREIRRRREAVNVDKKLSCL